MKTMKSARPQAAYGCSQQDLYTLVQVGWTSYNQYLPSFEAHSLNYDAQRSVTALTTLETVRLMPDEWSRREVHKTLRVQLNDLSVDALRLWSSLSVTYIRDSFPVSEHENKRLAAGQVYYAEALRRDWEKVNHVLSSGLAFLNENAATLTAGGMPAAFANNYATARTAYMNKYNEYVQALEDSRNLTDAKILANNALYTELVKVFNDGKEIFRDNAAVRLQFSVTQVLDLITGNGNGGDSGEPGPTTDARIAGLVTSAADGMPLGGAEVRAYTLADGPSGPSVGTTTDANGLYTILIPEMSEAEEIVIEASIAGYGTGQRNLLIGPGETFGDENFSLMPA